MEQQQSNVSAATTGYNYTIKQFWVTYGHQTINIPKASFILGFAHVEWGNQFSVSVMGNWDRPLVDRPITIYRDKEPLQPTHNLANYKGMARVERTGETYYVFVD